MERSNRWLLVCARFLLVVVFLLNGFGLNFCKNMAIWGGLVFVVINIQTLLLPRQTIEVSGVHARSNAQAGAIHVEAD